MALLPEDPREFGRLVALGSVGMEMVAPIGIGWVLDYYLGWKPWGVVGGAVLGFFGGLVHLLRLLQVQERQREQERSGPPREKP